MRRLIVLALALATLEEAPCGRAMQHAHLAGCGERLDEPSLVKTPRVLAMVAEPPSAPPGEDVALSALVVDPAGRELEMSWTLCATEDLGDFGRGGGGGGGGALSDGNAQYGAEVEREGCVEGAPGVIALPGDGRGGATVPGAATRAFYDDLEALADTYGELIDPETVRFVIETSGLPLTAGLTVRANGEELVRAFKRILVFTGDEQNTNPPPPRFSIGHVWVSAQSATGPFACAPDGTATPTVRPNREVSLLPDPDDLRWRERYQVIEVTGEVGDREENAFYSWFSTAGRFDDDDTSAPNRDNTWRSPRTPGTYPMWLVVRDGHGGTSACRTDVTVEP
jgi:hypothetical protein